MDLLVTATAALGAVVLLHIALTAGLLVRLRALQESGFAAQGTAPAAAPALPAPGTVVTEFTAYGLDGRAVGTADLTGPALAVFVSAGCPACGRAVAGLVEHPPDCRILAFVVGSAEDRPTRQLVDRLAPLGVVSLVGEDAPSLRAFGVSAVPALVAVHRAVVTAAATRPAELPVTAG